MDRQFAIMEHLQGGNEVLEFLEALPLCTIKKGRYYILSIQSFSVVHYDPNTSIFLVFAVVNARPMDGTAVSGEEVG